METIPSAPKYSQPFYQDIISRFSSSTTEVMPQTSSQQIAIPINSTSTCDTFTDPSSIVDTNSQQQYQFYCPCCGIHWTRYNLFLNHLNNRHFVNPIRCRQPNCSRTFADLNDYLSHLRHDHYFNASSFTPGQIPIGSCSGDDNHCLVVFIIMIGSIAFISLIIFIKMYWFET